MTQSWQSCHDHESLPGPERISLHGVIFVLRKVESTSDVNRGPEPCQSGTALTFPILCQYRPKLHVPLRSIICSAHAHDDHYRTRSKFNSLFTEMITPQTYNYIYIYTYKTASCTLCIRGSLRLAPNKSLLWINIWLQACGYCRHSQKLISLLF